MQLLVIETLKMFIKLRQPVFIQNSKRIELQFIYVIKLIPGSFEPRLIHIAINQCIIHLIANK